MTLPPGEISVIVACGGRVEQLRACLDALANQARPAPRFEVLLVGDGPLPGSGRLADEYAAAFAIRVCGAPGGAAGMNRAAAVARGQFCVFVDDGVIADPLFVAEHLATQRGATGPVVGIGTIRVRAGRRASRFARYLAAARSSDLLEHGAMAPSTDLPEHRPTARTNAAADHLPAPRASAAAAREPGLPTDWTALAGRSLSVQRDFFLASGGFAADLTARPDVELIYRLAQAGAAPRTIPGASGERVLNGSARECATDAEQAGDDDYALFLRHPALLGGLPLGAFNDLGMRGVLLRRLLLRLNSSRLARALHRLVEWFDLPAEWYRLLYSYHYWQGVRRAAADGDAWQRLTRGPVILMYHAVGTPGERASQYIVPARRFALHMAWLKARRYSIVSVAELVRWRREHRLPPARAVAITFDDGYQDNSSTAYPILARLGLTATIYVTTRSVDGVNTWDRHGRLAGRPMLRWTDIAALYRRGLEIGAHTRTHPPLPTVAPGQVEAEVSGARNDLERALGAPVTTFAYPHGKHTAEVRAFVEQAGFRGACGTDSGVNDPRVPLYALLRAEIRGTDSLLSFALTTSCGITGVPWRIWRGQ